MADFPSLKPETSAVELRDVTKRFGGTTALDALSLTARAGEFLTLLGPSGCGKTTALRLISGLEQPDAGGVYLAGADVTSLPPHRREVNQVFQSYALFPHLSVFDNVAFGLRMKKLPAGEIRPRVDRALALVALDGLERRRPAQLSGGQRQRVALARALVCEPRVLLLDEPLSALDARLRAQVREELRALQRRLGLTFILVTHDQEEALAVSDRIAVIHRGRVEQIGGVEDIYHRPSSRFVAGFVGEANLLEARLTGNSGDGDDSGGRTWCRLEAGGQLLALSSPPLPDGPAGKTFTLLIRPEHVRLAERGAPGQEAPNTFDAVVEERIFQGASVTLHLRVGETLRLRAFHPSGAGPAPAAGTRVSVHLTPSDCVPLPG